jgi:hypothetical protein
MPLFFCYKQHLQIGKSSNPQIEIMPLFSSRREQKKIKVSFANGLLFVERADGRQQAFPLEWFPKLQNATEEERDAWVQTNTGLRWDALDLDISI